MLSHGCDNTPSSVVLPLFQPVLVVDLPLFQLSVDEDRNPACNTEARIRSRLRFMESSSPIAIVHHCVAIPSAGRRFGGLACVVGNRRAGKTGMTGIPRVAVTHGERGRPRCEANEKRQK